MTNLFKRLLSLFQMKPEPEDNREESVEKLRNFLIAIENTHEVEYDCEQVYQLLDQYAEMIERGENASGAMPLVQHHLEMCRDCNEEYEALLRVLEHPVGA